MKLEDLEVMYFHGETIDECKFTISGRVDGDDLILGIAICSEKENFNKAIGRTISSGRCLSQREHPRGRTFFSLYGSDLKLNHQLELEVKGEAGWKENYFVGKEIRVFTAIVSYYNHFTKKELQRQFRLN